MNSAGDAGPPSADPAIGRKRAVLAAADQLAPDAERWRDANRYFHDEDLRYLRFVIPPGRRILDLGCGTGWLLAGLAPARGVGIDLSPAMIAQARSAHPHLEFRTGDVESAATIDALAGETFDFILVTDTIGVFEDIQATFDRLHALCTPDTRIVVTYYGVMWEPILALARLLGLKKPEVPQNWLSTGDIRAILDLAGFETIRREWRTLLPKRWLGLGPLINRVLAPLPGLRRFCVRNHLVVRSHRLAKPSTPSVSVVIPARNERGNIADAVARLPMMAAARAMRCARASTSHAATC